jgi:hypothetical protein
MLLERLKGDVHPPHTKGGSLRRPVICKKPDLANLVHEHLELGPVLTWTLAPRFRGADAEARTPDVVKNTAFEAWPIRHVLASKIRWQRFTVQAGNTPRWCGTRFA